MLRKNVSISDAHLKLLEPLLKKHQGNLSAAMRDIIDFTGFVTENMGSLETAKDILKEKNHVREQIQNRIYGVTIPLTMFRWLLASRKYGLPPMCETLQLFAPHNDINVYDTNSLNKIINEELSILNWPTTVSVDSGDDQISIQVTGTDPEINNFAAILISMYLSNNKNPQKIIKLLLYPSSISMKFSNASCSEDAQQSIYTYLCDNTEKMPDQNGVILVKAE
ncbi:Uncharacterised protein [uncultured archaeon]|nr:Uncharacterised protein [uncultured archaeon]